jgi:tRNA(fMet)-specific endonuclease VapC
MITFFDTDICIAILRGKEPELEARLKTLPMESVALSAVVVGELWVGVEKSLFPETAKKKLQTFLRDLPTVSFDEYAAKKYGEIRAILEKRGISIGGNDLLIAATVCEQGARLITRNRRDYERVPGLHIEVW